MEAREARRIEHADPSQSAPARLLGAGDGRVAALRPSGSRRGRSSSRAPARPFARVLWRRPAARRPALPPVAVTIGVAVAVVARHGDRDARPGNGDARRRATTRAAGPRGASTGAGPSASQPGLAEPALEAVLLARGDGLAAARAGCVTVRRLGGRCRRRSASGRSSGRSGRRSGPERRTRRSRLPRRRRPRAPWSSASISLARASIATSSAQRSTTSVSLKWSRRYISRVSPPSSRRRSSRSRSSARRSRRRSLAAGAAGLLREQMPSGSRIP